MYPDRATPGEPTLEDRVVDRPLSLGAERPALSKHGPRSMGVQPPAAVGVADGLQASGQVDPGPDHLRGLRHVELVVLHLRGERFDMSGDVDPVGDRAADLALVVAPDGLAALAPVGAGVGPPLTAGAGIAGQDDHPAGRQQRRLALPGDGHVAALHRLAQGVDHVGPEERELVQEQDAAVGPAQLARPDLTAATTDQAGLARVVVGRRVGRFGEHPLRRVEDARQRVDRGELERLLRGSARGGSSGSVRRCWSCPNPWGPTAAGGGRRRRRPRRRTWCRPSRAGRRSRAPRGARRRARPAACCSTAAPPAAPRAPPPG